MLSGVLNSPRAVHANISIMRAFVKLRELIGSNELIRQKIEELEKKFEKHDHQISAVFEAIRELLEVPKPPKRKPIGFHAYIPDRLRRGRIRPQKTFCAKPSLA